MNDIKQAFLESEEVQRLKALEGVLDKNPQLQSLISNLKEKQKQMVNAKEFHQPNQYAIYKKEYDDLYAQILDFPFVEEYLEVLENINSTLKNITGTIETIINNKLDA